LVASDGKKLDVEAIVLANGCICCSVKDDLFVTVEQVAKSVPPFELIVVEVK